MKVNFIGKVKYILKNNLMCWLQIYHTYKSSKKAKSSKINITIIIGQWRHDIKQ